MHGQVTRCPRTADFGQQSLPLILCFVSSFSTISNLSPLPLFCASISFAFPAIQPFVSFSFQHRVDSSEPQPRPLFRGFLVDVKESRHSSQGLHGLAGLRTGAFVVVSSLAQIASKHLQVSTSFTLHLVLIVQAGGPGIEDAD